MNLKSSRLFSIGSLCQRKKNPILFQSIKTHSGKKKGTARSPWKYPKGVLGEEKLFPSLLHNDHSKFQRNSLSAATYLMKIAIMTWMLCPCLSQIWGLKFSILLLSTLCISLWLKSLYTDYQKKLKKKPKQKSTLPKKKKKKSMKETRSQYLKGADISILRLLS